MPNKKVSVKTNIKENFTLESKSRGHVSITDQPSPMGQDKGPTPLEYLFISLGGCLCTIGKIIAKEKGIDLNDIKVEVKGDLDTDVLMGKNKNARPGFQNIKCIVDVDAAMSKKEKEDFIHEVDERCPISDNISNLSTIKFEVK